MKPLVTLLALFLLFNTQLAVAQDKKLTYKYWRTEGIKKYKDKDYETAIKYFRLAETLPDAPTNNDIDTWIEKSFDGYIVLLKAAERKARLEAEASEMAGLAYKLGKNNPTIGLRVAQKATQLGTNSISAKQQFHDIISSFPAPFYASVLEHGEMVSSVAASPNRMEVVTACWDERLRLWHYDGTLIKEFSGHEAEVLAVSFSSDGSYILSGSADNSAILWNRQGEVVQQYRGHTGDVTSVCFSPDNK